MEIKDFDADEIVDAFIQLDETYDYYEDNTTLHIDYDGDLYDYEEPLAKEFYADLEDYAEEQLDRYITREEQLALQEEFNRQYNVQVEHWREYMYEKQLDYDDNPY